MKSSTRILVSSLILLLFFGALSAQQTGEIRGKVADEAGEALPGVSITARSPSLQGARTALSDKSGSFRLPLLPVGAYALTFELAGFEKLTMTGNSVRLGLALSLTVVLRPSTVREEVTVVASNPLIDATLADVSQRLNSGDLALAPTQARTIAEIVDLTPGVTGVRTNTVTGGADQNWITDLTAESGLPGFRGAGNGANNWFVDGLSTKGVAYGDPGVRLNFDAWDEVQIVSDGFSPLWGQGVGGFINIVTRSGGNAFHGELGGLIQGAGLRARRKEQMSAVSVPEASRGQYYANLGGPIVKDKLWFFVSDDFFANTDRTREQTLVWLTVPDGKRRASTNNLLGKITLTPRQGQTVSLSGTIDEFLDQSGGIGVPETYTRPDYSRHSYRLNYRAILSPNAFLTAAWGQNRNSFGIQPLSGDFGPPPYAWQDIGQQTNNASFGQETRQKRTDLAVGLVRYLSLGSWGDHELKAGASHYGASDVESYHWTGLDADLWPGDGFDNGAGISWMSPGHPNSEWESAPGEAKNTTRGFGFYFEDNVVLGRLSLMIGLRTDTQQVFNDAGVRVWSWGVGDFLQPRASLAWDLGGNGRNVLKFGYGLYAMPVSTDFLPFVNTAPLFARRIFRWIGPADPTEAQLADSANWRLTLEQTAPRDVDPGLKPDKTNRFLLEYDRQIGRNWAVKVRGIHSNAHNLINPISIYDPAAPMGMRRLLTNFELKRRNYRALEIELNGKVPGRLALNASWTWSRAKGTTSGDIFEAVSWDLYFGGFYDSSLFGYHPWTPDDSPYHPIYEGLFRGLGGRGIGDEGWYGTLPYSVDHVIKAFTTWLAPYGVNVSAAVEYLSGYHWEMKGWSPAVTFCATFPEGRGARTTPAHAYVDLLVEKEIRFRRAPTLGLGINVYNVLNSQRPVSFFKNGENADGSANPLFGRVWARQLPRWVQLRFSLKF
ncbi:MAG TPA: TonB-dependent receptor [Candidatus Aminicenantes bacterium]|nr:TonB-dependent receptor [Candidatus Aminicenantes bacterium]HRY64497.1 TonB-dependent receptor [Candidatus Aminicenantes bacterium]HRZ71410.1 TonB-dependent receptor [Candidatus Aminicenantes bacterium]